MAPKPGPVTDSPAVIAPSSSPSWPATPPYVRAEGAARIARRRADEPLKTPPPGDALGTALWLAGGGLWVVPISPLDDPLSPNPGKAPVGRGWGTRRLSTRALFTILRRHPRAGVGLALGPA